MFLRTIALGTALLIAPLAPAAAGLDTTPTPAPSAVPAPEAKPTAPAATPDAVTPKATAEDKRICKSVRADASSRRKTRICRTAEEWRELNIPT